MSIPGTDAKPSDLRVDKESAAVYQAALGKRIKSAHLIDNVLRLIFEDGSAIEFLNDEPMCCELRFMVVCDDPLGYYAGATFLYAEIADGPKLVEPDPYEAHLVQFLRVHTSQGVIVVSNHNEGRYWSFALLVRNVAI
jgi:hypothetical protein